MSQRLQRPAQGLSLLLVDLSELASMVTLSAQPRHVSTQLDQLSPRTSRHRLRVRMLSRCRSRCQPSSNQTHVRDAPAAALSALSTSNGTGFEPPLEGCPGHAALLLSLSQRQARPTDCTGSSNLACNLACNLA
jgi:hypothetical protein